MGTDVEGLHVPRPLRAGASVAAVGLLPLVAGLAGWIRPLSALIFAGIFVLGGAVRGALTQHELAGLRRRGDDELRLRRESYLVSAVAAWRSGELTSERHRRALARSVARTEGGLSAAKLPGASPLNRVAARPHADLLSQLAERLEALDRPVRPEGVLKVEALLTSPDSPLYADGRAGEVRQSLLACLRALELSPGSRQQQRPAGRDRKWLLAVETNRAHSSNIGPDR